MAAGTNAFRRAVRGGQTPVVLVAITSAAFDDRWFAPVLFSQLDPINHLRLETIWADGKYHNDALYDWLDHHPKCNVIYLL